jgi:hypothetical protein
VHTAGIRIVHNKNITGADVIAKVF